MHILANNKFSSPVLTGLLFCILLGLFSCSENNLSDIEMMKEKEKLPLLVGSTVIIEYTDSSILQAKIYAPLLKEFASPDNYTELPNGVYIEFFNNLGEVSTRMRSNYARLDKATDLMTAKDSVIVINENGEKLNTDKLHWNNTTKMLHTDAFVQISKKEEILFGEGLEANESFTKYKILRPQGSIAIQN